MIHVVVAIAAIIAIVILAKGCIREHREAKRIQGVLDELEGPNWFHHEHRGVSVLAGLTGDDLADWCQRIVHDYAKGEHA